jgi:hypothetical protein
MFSAGLETSCLQRDRRRDTIARQPDKALVNRSLSAAGSGNDLEQPVAARRQRHLGAGDHLAGNCHRVGEALHDGHDRLRLERSVGEPGLDRLLDLRRRSPSGRNAPGIGDADRAIALDQLQRNLHRLSTGHCPGCLGRTRGSAGDRTFRGSASGLRLLRSARSAELLSRRFGRKRLDSRRAAARGQCRGRLGEQASRRALPNHHRDHVADRDLHRRGLGVFLEASRETFLRLRAQGGDYMVVYLDDIEQDLSLRPRLLDDFAR